MLRVITLNLNGIRSAARKGFFEWIKNQNADVICLQEIKAQEADLSDTIFRPKGYHCFYHYAEQKGYSGVAIFSKEKPKQIIMGLGWPDVDKEGRYVEVELEKLNIASIYIPSGTSGDHRQAIKIAFLKEYAEFLKKLRERSPKFILCGDWNIAHTKMDLKNWRGNQKNTGFLPEERAWMDNLFGEMGFVDAFRTVNQEADQYTWWSNRGQAWAKNVGWRIDYQVITPALKNAVKSVAIFKDQRFSDHAPLTIDYEI